MPIKGKRARASITSLYHSVRKKGNLARFMLLDTIEEGTFPHVKVMTVDGVAAYVGSANLTAAALERRNLELGVRIHGNEVEIIDEFLDMYTGRGAS